jgi:hypothetical protein
MFSFMWLHKGKRRHLAKGMGRGAWPICSLDRNLYLIYCCVMYNLVVCGLIFDHYILRSISSVSSGKLKPEVIRKTYLRSTLAFIKAVERKGRVLGGNNGPAFKRPRCMGVPKRSNP